MSTHTGTEMPWVITHLGRSLFGLNCSVVREIVIMPDVCGVPGVPKFIRGVINLRGRVTPVVECAGASECTVPASRPRSCAA